jgi:hypothetical protein
MFMKQIYQTRIYNFKYRALTRKTYQQIIRAVDLCFPSANKTKKKLHIVDDKRRSFLSIAFSDSFK